MSCGQDPSNRSTTVIIRHQKKERPSSATQQVLCSLMLQTFYFLCSPRLRSSSQNTLRPWRDMHGSLLILTAKVKTRSLPKTIFHPPRGGLNSLFLFFFFNQWPSCRRMSSCSCNQSWWVSPRAYLCSSQDFLVHPASERKTGLHDFPAAQLNVLELIFLRQWNVSASVFLSQVKKT